jgi:hypothetical protein
MASVIFSARREFFGNGFDGHMDRGEGHPQPAAAFVGAEQHHGGAPGAGEFGKKFRLADEFMPRANDGLLVDRRGDERVQFTAQAALAAVAQSGHGGVGRQRGTGGKLVRQRRRGIDKKEPALAGIIGKFLEGEWEGKFCVQPGKNFFIADEQIFCVVGPGFGGNGFEGDFRADAGDVAEGNSEPALHG